LNAAKQRLNTERSEVLESHVVVIERRPALECCEAAIAGIFICRGEKPAE